MSSKQARAAALAALVAADVICQETGAEIEPFTPEFSSDIAK
jgi:hypothetical protein